MRVRYQLAFTLGQIDSPQRFAALATIARRDGADKWMRVAVLSSLSSGAGEVFSILAADKDWRTTRTRVGRFWRIWPTYIGHQNHPQEADHGCWRRWTACRMTNMRWRPVSCAGLSEGLAVGSEALRARLAALDGGKAAEGARRHAGRGAGPRGNDQEKPAARAEAIRLLSLDSFADAGPVLMPLVASQQPAAVQSAALNTLAKFADVAIARAIVEAWPSMSPRLRSEATEALFSRAAWLAEFLAAAEQEKLSLADLDPARVRALGTTSGCEDSRAGGSAGCQDQAGAPAGRGRGLSRRAHRQRRPFARAASVSEALLQVVIAWRASDTRSDRTWPVFAIGAPRRFWSTCSTPTAK